MCVFNYRLSLENDSLCTQTADPNHFRDTYCIYGCISEWFKPYYFHKSQLCNKISILIFQFALNHLRLIYVFLWKCPNNDASLLTPSIEDDLNSVQIFNPNSMEWRGSGNLSSEINTDSPPAVG